MLNNLILTVFLIIIAAGWLKKRPDVFLTSALVFTFAAPVMRLGSSSFNSSYLLTALLVLLSLIDMVFKRRASHPVPRVLKLFAGLMALVLFTYTAGFILHGTAGAGSFIVSMAGEINIIVLTLLLALNFSWETSAARSRIFVLTGWIFVGLQAGMVLFQKLFFEPAWKLTYQLFAGDGRQEPLEMILVSDPPFFKRAYGTFYSPTLFGLAALVPTLLFGYLAIASHHEARRLKAETETDAESSDPSAYSHAYRRSLIYLAGSFLGGLIGTFSLSKGFMLSIGILLIYLLFIALIIGKRPRLAYLFPWSRVAVSIALAFVIVYVSMPSFASGTRDYYFGFLFNPFSALTSRYGSGAGSGGEGGINVEPVDSIPISDENRTALPAAETSSITSAFGPPAIVMLTVQGYAPGTQIPLPTDSEGNVLVPVHEESSGGGGQMAQTYDVFRRHWLTGVGPLPIEGEFLGDSQIVQAGHNGGVLAVGAYLGLFVWLYVKAWKERQVINLLLMPVIAIGCISIAFLGQVVSVGIMVLSLTAALPERLSA